MRNPADLEREIGRLRRSVRLMGVATVAMAGLLTAAATSQSRGPAEEHLRVRSLTVVDEQGIERVILGAPVPGPMIGGERQRRIAPASGILLNGPDGNERGGYLVTDVGDEGVLTLDDAAGNEVFKVVANPDAGASLFLMHGGGAMVAATTYRGAPELHLIGPGRKPVQALPEGTPAIR